MLSGIFMLIAVAVLITPATFYFVNTTNNHGSVVDTFDLEFNDDMIVISSFINSNIDKNIHVSGFYYTDIIKIQQILKQTNHWLFFLPFRGRKAIGSEPYFQ